MGSTFYYSNFAHRVSVLIHKGLPFVLLQVISDPQGKYVIFHVTVHATLLILVGLYAPPVLVNATLPEVSVHIATLHHCPILLLGDFNAVVDPKLDRLKPRSNDSKTLANWCLWICGYLVLDIS